MIAPIVDYHIMRTTLRTGCVAIVDSETRQHLTNRTWLGSDAESSIRVQPGTPSKPSANTPVSTLAAVDGFLFSLGRRLCLETEPPKCAECPLEDVCAREVDLFQPIFRTTAY